MSDILAEARPSDREGRCAEMMLSGGVLLSRRPEDAPPSRPSDAPSTSPRRRRGSRRHTPFIGSGRFSGDSYGAVLLDHARSSGGREGALDPAPHDPAHPDERAVRRGQPDATACSDGRGGRRGEPSETSWPGSVAWGQRSPAMSWARRLLGLPDAAEDQKPDSGGRRSDPARSPIAPAPAPAEPTRSRAKTADPREEANGGGEPRPGYDRDDLSAWDGIWQGRRSTLSEPSVNRPLRAGRDDQQQNDSGRQGKAGTA